MPRFGLPSVFALALAAATQSGGIVGVWRGTSTCADRQHFPACNNEIVVYTVTAHPGTRDTVTIQADKVVNGVREDMGSFDLARVNDSTWAVDFRMRQNHGRITFVVSGDRLTGTMVDVPTGYRVRDMAARRS